MKRIIMRFLAPLARFVASLDPLRRAWASAMLAIRIHEPLDESSVILGAPEVHGTKRIRLGKGLYLYRDIHLETQEHGSITIGDRVVISRGVHIVSFVRVEIGDFSMLGEYTSIRDANHVYGGGGPIRDAGHSASSVLIGRNVWISRGVTILPGVQVGDNAVVGANAVVTRNVPAGAVVAGVPARPLPVRRAS